MNTTLILIPVAGLGLAATIVLGGLPGDHCKQQSACTGVAAGAAKSETVSEPSVAQRSLVRFLGEGQAVAAPLAPHTMGEPAAQGACSVKAAGACQATQASVATRVNVATEPSVATALTQATATKTGVATVLTPVTTTTVVQSGYGAVGGQFRAGPPAEEPVAAVAECQAKAAQELAIAQEVEAKRYADLALAQKVYAEAQAQQAAEQAVYAQDAVRYAKDAELAAAQYAKVAPRPYPTQERSAPDDYTRSLERRIEALERRLLEREHGESTPPSVYNATPGSGAKIMRTPVPGRGGRVATVDEGRVTIMGEDGRPVPYAVVEPEELPGVIVVPPDAKGPIAVPSPRAPSAMAVPVAPAAPRAPEPEVRTYTLRPPGRGMPSGAPGSDLSELTQLIEEMRAQVADLQRDLETLRDDLHNVRMNRNLGVR